MTPFPAAGLVPIPAPSTPVAGVWWFRLAADSPCFDGHFEHAPVLPGVAHLAMVLTACAQQARRERLLAGAREIRFSRPLRPGDEVEVELRNATEPSAVRFQIRCRGELATAGLLIFERDTDDGRS